MDHSLTGKKIAIIENNLLSTYTMRETLMLRLKEEGCDITVITQSNQYVNLVQNWGIKVIDVGFSNQNPIKGFKYIYRVYNALKKTKPDVCLTFSIRPAIWGNIVTRILRIPTITNITGIGPLFTSKNMVYRLARIMYKYVLNRTKKVFFQNYDDMNLFIQNKFVKPEVAQIIPGSGVDYNKFKPMHNGVNGHNGTNGHNGKNGNHHTNGHNGTNGHNSANGHNGTNGSVGNKPFVFLFIGRLMKDKGILEYINAARNIKKTYPSAVFEVIGPLWNQNLKTNVISEIELQEWRKEKVINYLGEKLDVRKSIADADCVVLPSYREGTSNVLLEASSMEKPCIATNTTGCKEIVEDDVTGFLCNVRDDKDLSLKMEKILHLPKEKRLEMGKKARQKIIREYDKEIVIKAYLAAIQEVSFVDLKPVKIIEENQFHTAEKVYTHTSI